MNDDDLRRAFDDLLEPLPPLGALPSRTARRAVRRRQLKLGAVGAGGAGVLVLAAALAVTTGDGGGGDEELRPAPFASTSPSPAPSVAPTPEPDPTTEPTGAPSPVAPTTPSPGATGTPAAPRVSAEPVTIRVALRPDGLGFTDGGPSSSSLAFGSDAATVKDVLDRALGAGGELETPDCGPGTSTVQYELLFLRLQDGRFVGWTTGSPGLTTGDGIGVGSTLAQLRDSFAQVTVTESTVGTEWTTGEGGVYGFLDGTAETSRVDSLSGGTTCVFR